MTTPYEYLKARRGEQCSTKLTKERAAEILRRRRLAQRYLEEARKLSNPIIAEKYGITTKSVSRIISGHRWKTGSRMSRYAGMEYRDAINIRALADSRDRFKRLAAQHSLKVIADELGVSESLVDAIGNGRRWIYLYAEAA